MWGSSFAELAKKAQESANNLSIQSPIVPELFNLNSLQGSSDADSKSNDESKSQNADDSKKDDKEKEDEAQSDLNTEMATESPKSSSDQESSKQMNSEMESSTQKPPSTDKDASSTEPSIEIYESRFSHSDLFTGGAVSAAASAADTSAAASTPDGDSASDPDDGTTKKEAEKKSLTTVINDDKSVHDESINIDVMKEETNENQVDATPGPQHGEKSTGKIEGNEDKEEVKTDDKTNEKVDLQRPVTPIKQIKSGDEEEHQSLLNIEGIESPTMKSMIESTSKLFDNSTRNFWKSSSADGNSSSFTNSSINSDSLTTNDGLSEEERNLESVSDQLTIEVNDTSNNIYESAMDVNEVKSSEDIKDSNTDDVDNEDGEWTDLNNVMGNDEQIMKPQADDSSPHSSEVMVEDPVGDEMDMTSPEIPISEFPHHDKPQNPITQPTQKPPDDSPPVQEVPQFAIEKFMDQLQRLDEHHQSEILELERKHKLELEEARKSGGAGQQQSSTTEVSDLKDELEHYKLRLGDLETVLRENEEEKQTTSKTIFNLKRDVEKAEFKFAKFEEQMGSQLQSSDDNSMKMNQEMESLRTELEEKTAAYVEFEHALSISKEETAAAQEQYALLKIRVKSVATELKERRGECREFTERVSSLEAKISTLTSEKSKMSAEFAETKAMFDEKDSSVQTLESQVKKLQTELNQLNVKKLKDEQKGDSALKAYKLKAQNALAAANSRAATANQAREEMHIECEGAKQATLDAEKKLRIALLEKSEMEKKFNAERIELEKEVEECYVNISNIEKRAEEAEERATQLEKEIEVSTKEQHKLFDEMERMEEEMEKEKQANSNLRTKHVEEKQRAEQLMKEVLELRTVQQRSSTDAFMAKKKEQEEKQTEDHLERTMISTSSRKNEAEGTIAMLQDELMTANEVIAELKEALQSLALERTAPERSTNAVIESDEFDHMQSNFSDMNLRAGGTMESFDNLGREPKTNTGNPDTPLFYALEKQAELTIAKNEINRLANILGDVESARVEAIEAREAMEKRMEEVEARAHRQEKFISPLEKKHGMELCSDPANDGENMNLEYLKNVILQYLNATSVVQRKALIPVVSAVLCLTTEEQRQAFMALENSSGLQNVGVSLIEGLETSLFGLSGSGGRATNRRENSARDEARRERRERRERRS